MGSLVDHAKRELELSGLLDKDSDYNGELGKAVLELIEVFEKQDHSGMSAHLTGYYFSLLADFKNIAPISSDSEEWFDHGVVNEEPLWQNKRRGSTFSRDGGRTWYDLHDESLNNGDTWKPKRSYPDSGGVGEPLN